MHVVKVEAGKSISTFCVRRGYLQAGATDMKTKHDTEINLLEAMMHVMMLAVSVEIDENGKLAILRVADFLDANAARLGAIKWKHSILGDFNSARAFMELVMREMKDLFNVYKRDTPKAQRRAKAMELFDTYPRFRKIARRAPDQELPELFMKHGTWSMEFLKRQ